MITTVPTVGKFASVDARSLMDDFRRATPRQAFEIIQTSYSGPTDLEGSSARAQSITSGITGQVAWDYALNADENHLAAAIDALTPSRSDWELVSRESTADGWCFAFRFVSEAA